MKWQNKFKSYEYRPVLYFWCLNGSHYRWHSENRKKQPCYLPYGKAEDVASPALSRVRSKVLQLHPRRL